MGTGVRKAAANAGAGVVSAVGRLNPAPVLGRIRPALAKAMPSSNRFLMCIRTANQENEPAAWAERFDMSTDETRAQSQMLAETLGIGDLYRDNYGVTGFVVLVDAESRREVGRLTTQHDQGAMRDIINAALAEPQS